MDLTKDQILAIQKAEKRFMPQAGGQTMFLSSPAKFTIYGGQAGAGKTYAMCLSTLRGYDTPGFAAATYRRHRKEHTAPGGLIDTSNSIFPHLGATLNKSDLKWTFPSGATESYEGLEAESDVHKHQGDQIPLLKFDELTHFTEKQFRYLFTRNRPGPGYTGECKVLATCNPDPDSWVKKFVEYYLNENGTPEHTKRGEIRYFASKNDEFFFGASKRVLKEAFGFTDSDCHSYTFIYGTLADNKYLNNEDYISSLKMGGEAETAALLYGNWNIRRSGKMFARHDFELFTVNPPHWEKKIITCDTAHGQKQHNDFSVMQVWGVYRNGIYLIEQFRDKVEFSELEAMLIALASKHQDATIYIEAKASGIPLIQTVRRKIMREIQAVQRNTDKYTRALSSQPYVRGGYVHLNPMSDYFADYTNEMVAFNAELTHKHDDQCDATFDAIDILIIQNRGGSIPSETVQRPALRLKRNC